MVCVDQHQFCNPSLWNDSNVDSCTTLTGANSLVGALDTIGYNPRQLATANRIQHILLTDSVYFSIGGRASSALQANSQVYKLLQAPLPDNQWVIEVKSWFTVSLAILQHAIVEFASGPTNLPPEARIITPTANGWPIMCKQQKVPNPGTYQNFSILALSLIFGIGAIILLLSWTLEPSINKWREKHDPVNHKRLQWILDNKLQLQRMAYEYANIGQWEKKGEGVPVTVLNGQRKIFKFPDKIDPYQPGLLSDHDILDQPRMTNGHPSRNGLLNSSQS
ncbi:hypothetical protein N7471_014051 [Penicillium samsonianum]|uniref:uncharacterized protein n=1 Tax=Penicillium samsonianum TaxID=1882272 RepID=UPI0025481831|nr:uncharacterized protein N7471_014051 [Penicillium samsonianum]KAJ6118174.1 hypothetical protein N7471_014051 [Penicillium samsonianum]